MFKLESVITTNMFDINLFFINFLLCKIYTKLRIDEKIEKVYNICLDSSSNYYTKIDNDEDFKEIMIKNNGRV